ncbi:MAG TPA: GGDEF domain-containing protein [Vicinamibacterales bacterium]|nr:GGDEF domain-containing protein [Vicinamibacterales bacterium]
MAERIVHVNFMHPEKTSAAGDSPQTRSELQAWVRDTLRLQPATETALLSAIDAVFTRHERLWQESKQEAIHALSAGFAEKMARVKTELSAKDATVSSISRYFEALVADLTERSHRDPKTKLMNFGRFTEQLESFLALEQRGRWCAVGLVDITGFKWYNDALGHSIGDRIIERVAQLLREQVRSDDLLAQERGSRAEDLHARFGGDEFCFLVPDLEEYHQAHSIAERFREAVERFNWATEDERLAVQPVRVDVGVVCMALGRVAERRFIARRLAADLIQRADKLMYEAKGERANHIYLTRARVENGQLLDVVD